MNTDFNAFIGTWPYWENPYADSTGAALIRLMDKHDIKRSVIVSLRAVFDDVRAGNDETFSACEKFNGRLFPSITINPFSPLNDKKYLNYCYQRGARIIKLKSELAQCC